jgi:transposase-like protein
MAKAEPLTQRRWLGAEKLARIKRLHEGGYSYPEIAIRIGVDRKVVRKAILRGCKQRSVDLPPTPWDLVRYAPVETIQQLQRRYSRGAETIRRWIAEKNIQRPNMHHIHCSRPCPPDFAARAGSMTIPQQEKAWNVSRPVITRWRKECGLPTPRADYIARKKAEQAPKPKVYWVDEIAMRNAA